MANASSSTNNIVEAEKAERKTQFSSILLRLTPKIAEEIRRVAKVEERTLTTVVTRAIKNYLKENYKIEIIDE